MRESGGDPLEVGEDPVALLIMQAVEGGREEPVVIHRKKPGTKAGAGAARAFLERFQDRCRAGTGPREVIKRGVRPLQVAHQNFMLINPAKTLCGPSQPFRTPLA